MLVLDVRVQPRASRNEFAGLHAGRLKIRLTAPPADGKANKQLIRYLASTCGVAKSQVELLSGQTSRNKRVLIHRPKRLPEGVKSAHA